MPRIEPVERRTYDADALAWRLRVLDAFPSALTATQVAAVLRCSARSVGRLAESGHLPRAGRLTVYRRADVRAFLLSRATVEPAAANPFAALGPNPFEIDLTGVGVASATA